MERLIKISIVTTLVLCTAYSANALTLSSVDGDWSNPVGGVGTIEYINGVVIGYGNGLEDQVRWGTSTGMGKSGLGFTGVAPPDTTFDIDEAFEIGQLRHFNNPVVGGTAATAVDLTISLNFSDPAGLNGTFNFTFGINETPNLTGTSPADDDFIYFPSSYPEETFNIGGTLYTLQLLGFGSGPGSLVDQFQSPEESTNSTLLWGKITTPIPAVNTDAANPVGQTTATLRGTVTSDGGEACQYRFRYKKAGGSYTYTSWTGSVTTGQSFSEAISGLNYGFTYYFNAQAKNSAGESNWGNEQSFTTGVSVSVPSVTTQSATNVSQTSATLHGSIADDGGQSCQYRFRYKKSGGSYTYTPLTGSVTTGQIFSETLSGLTPGSTYYFNAQAKNSAGESDWGNERIFTTGTSVSVPSVNTLSATNVGQTSATLRGSITNDGGEACQYRFEYWTSGFWAGTSWSYDTKTTGESFYKDISTLRPGCIYHFRAQAKNSTGESEGNIESFSTYPDEPLFITEIRSDHCSPTKHTYYLNGVSLNEKFTVTIDWKGNHPDKIKWITPTKTYEYDCPGTTFSRTFDMGNDFGVGGKLSVIAVAAGGSPQSASKKANFDVIPPPPGIPTYLLEEYTSGSEILYKTSRSWILEAINEGVGEGKIDDYIPIFGAKALMLIVHPRAVATVTGSGTAWASIAIGSGLPKFPIDGIEMEMGRIELSLDWTYSSTTKAWVPRGKIQMWVKGRYETPPFYVWLTPPIYWQGYVKGNLNGAYVALTGWQHDGRPLWEGEIPFYIGAGLEIGVGLADFLSAEGYLGGGADMLVVFPNADPLQKLTIVLEGGVDVHVLIFWRWHKELLRYEWDLKRQQIASAGLLMMTLSTPEKDSFEIMDRDYLSPDYAVWIPAAPKKKGPDLMLYEAPAPSEPKEEQLLQSNVFGQSQPTLATDGNDLFLAWIYDDPNRTSINRTKVLFSKCHNSTWSQPIAIDDDGTADFSPQLAILSGGNALCVWENVNCNLPDDATLTDMAASMEIATAHYDSLSGVWTTEALTDNIYLDRTPRIATADNNKAIAVWISNEKDDILGLDVNALNKIRYSSWDGINWSEPNIVAAGIGLIVKTALAYNGDQATYVYTLDEDHNWQTDSDQELYAITYDGFKWSQPIRLTNDTVIDANPQVLYDRNDLFLVWYRDANLVSCHNLDMNNVQQVLRMTASSGSMDFRLAKSPVGQISLVWTDTSTNGVDIFTATYDPKFSIWSDIYHLTSDNNMEKSLAAAYVGFDELAVAYNKVNIIYNNGIPEPNRVDLCILRHQIKNDLAITSPDISLSVANPLPGSIVNVNAVIHNLGDVAEVNVPVAFYNGDPDADGTLISDIQTIGGPIPAAGTATASVSWLVPEVNEPQQIYVVVDPDFILEDANRNNNIASISAMSPDLTVAYIMSERTGPKMRSITARVANTGVLSVQNVNVVIRQDSASGPQLASFNIANLDPNSFYDVSFDWDLACADLNSTEVLLYAIADESNTFAESDETNNIAFGLIDAVEVADITGDGKIDLEDMCRFSEHWIHNCIEPDWCAGSDFNHSRQVDFADYAIFAEHWLEGTMP